MSKTALEACRKSQIKEALAERLGRATAADPTVNAIEAQLRDLSSPAPLPVIRTIHHMACTGGTIICRFLATTPNARLLSEIDPLSTVSKVQFSPLDLALQYRNAVHNAGGAVQTMEMIDIFMAGLGVIVDKAQAQGARLIMRDHAHSHFCVGSHVPDRPTLRQLLARDYQLRSVVTVRHPLESYLGVLHNKFAHFLPGTLEDYCRRYIAFLDAHEDLPLIRYENFVAHSEKVMQELCQLLDLPYNPNLQSLVPAITLTGNSGRRGDIPEVRPRREIPSDVAQMRQTSPAYDRLCSRLEYEA